MTTTLETNVTNYLLTSDWGERGDAVVESFLLNEDGTYVLLEFGDKIILEEITPTYVLLEDGSFLLTEDGDKIIGYDTSPDSRSPLLLSTEVTNYLLGG